MQGPLCAWQRHPRRYDVALHGKGGCGPGNFPRPRERPHQPTANERTESLCIISRPLWRERGVRGPRPVMRSPSRNLRPLTLPRTCLFNDSDDQGLKFFDSRGALAEIGGDFGLRPAEGAVLDDEVVPAPADDRVARLGDEAVISAAAGQQRRTKVPGEIDPLRTWDGKLIVPVAAD